MVFSVTFIRISKKPVQLILQINHTFTVQYLYIPSWNKSEYAGPARVDITNGDIIKIWLDKGENKKWGPTLSGNTIEHIRYTDKRNEPISEPTSHRIIQIISTCWQQYQGIIVLGCIIILNIFIVLVGLKSRSKQSKMQ